MSPLVWSSLIVTETDYWTGMAPAMLVIALDFGTGVIARTRPQSMEWTTATGDRLGAAHLRPAPRRRPGLAILASVAAAVKDEAASRRDFPSSL
ncbi:hypothetical protein ACGF0C_09975 [Streptomyces albidoflavus]|uniref:hypothetical protein n=1 Tax=Streptomyces sp. FR-008 TaxID=206662 RepID=UPI000B021B95|nr:hypothetical protein [Streptomyces sp. FR-008]